jgi:hypothetical protein
MSDINDELSKRMAALRAQLNKITPTSAYDATTTALLDDYVRIRNMFMHVSVLEPEQRPAAETTKMFLELTAEIDPLLPFQRKLRVSNKAVAAARRPVAKLSLASVLAEYATPDTVRVITYAQIVREGLKGLCERQEAAGREVHLLRNRSVVVSHELAWIGRRLNHVREVLNDMQSLVERFSFFEAPEIILLQEPEHFQQLFEDEPVPELLALLQAVHTMQRQQSLSLTAIEECLHRLKLDN